MTYTVKAYYRHGHGDEPVIISGPEDIDTLVDALAESPLNSLAALYVNERPLTEHGYPDHTLRVGIHPDTKTGSVYYSLGMQAWYAAGRFTERQEGVVYNYMHHPETFPSDSEIDLDSVRSLAKEFLTTGGQRPAGVEWKPWPGEQI